MWTRFVVLPLAAAFGLAVAGLLAVGLVVVLAYPQLPSLEALTAYQPKIPLRIYTAEGVLMGEFGEERRSFIPIGDVPQQLKNAVIAACQDPPHRPPMTAGTTRVTATIGPKRLSTILILRSASRSGENFSCDVWLGSNRASRAASLAT